MGLLSFSLLIVIVSCAALTTDAATTCKREYKKTGCFKRNEKVFKHLLITDLDPTHHKWGEDMDWGDYHAGLHSLACRCRTKAVAAGYKWFSLGFHGECWGTSEQKFEVNHMEIGECVNGDFVACDHTSTSKECAGIIDNDFVYEVTTAVPGKSLIGYWDVIWSSNEPAKYSIEVVDNVAIIRIVKCSWSIGGTVCNTAKHANIKTSTHANYPAKDGWLQADDLHDGKLHIFIKEKNGKIVDMIWLRPLTGYIETSKVTEGVAPGPPSELTPTATCTFEIGDGAGGTEIKIGKQTGNDCINACIERKKKDSRINGVTIYKTGGVGGCWCELNMKRVAKDVYSTRLYKTCFITPVYVDLAPKQLALVKNNLAYTLPVLKKEYEIFFEVFPTKWNAKWGSILHLTTSDNIDEYGARIPGVWFAPNPSNRAQNSICPATALSGNLNYHFNSPKVDLNKWTRMRLTQQLSFGKYIYRVFLNGVKIHEKENTKPQEFHNVKVFLGDPWYEPQPGFIRNVNIRNIREQTKDSVVMFQQKLKIAKKQQPYLLPKLSKQFDVSFEVFPTSFTQATGGSNVLHMTTLGDQGKGMRIPGVWFGPNPVGNKNSLHVAFEMNACVVTTGGDSGGACCTFPFTYKGKTHTQCIQDDHTKPWCGTTAYGSKWGECTKKECLVKTTGGDSGGACCSFPFTYKGKTHTQCIQDDHTKPWCGTTAGGSKWKWGECVMTGYDTPNVNSNEWTTLRITQQLEGSKYMYRIFLNGKMIHGVENKNPQDFSNVKVFAADNWHNTQAGYIRNLRIHSLDRAQVAPSNTRLKLVRARASSTYSTYTWTNGHSYSWNAVNAIDGDTYTFSATVDPYGWWEAELEQPAVLSGIDLSLGEYPFRMGYYSDLKLQVARYPGDPWLDVKAGLKITGPNGGEYVYVQKVDCDVKIPVKYVRISISKYLYLSEVKMRGVEIQEPVLPLVKPTSISTYGDMKRWVPKNAIDGKLDTFSVTKVVSTAWWEAELKNAAVIANVNLYLGAYANRKQYYRNLKVQVRGKPTDPWSNCVTGTKIRGPIGGEESFPHEVHCKQTAPSKYIRIVINVNNPLYLSEVIVHGKA